MQARMQMLFLSSCLVPLRSLVWCASWSLHLSSGRLHKGNSGSCPCMVPCPLMLRCTWLLSYCPDKILRVVLCEGVSALLSCVNLALGITHSHTKHACYGSLMLLVLLPLALQAVQCASFSLLWVLCQNAAVVLQPSTVERCGERASAHHCSHDLLRDSTDLSTCRNLLPL